MSGQRGARLNPADIRPQPYQPRAAEHVDGLLEDDDWWAEPTVTGDRCLAVRMYGQWTYKTDDGPFEVPAAVHEALGEFLLPAMVFDGEMVNETLWLVDLPFSGLIERPVVSPCDPFHRRRVALEETCFSVGWTTGPVRLVPRFSASGPKRMLWDREVGRGGVTFRHVGGVYNGQDAVVTVAGARRQQRAG